MVNVAGKCYVGRLSSVWACLSKLPFYMSLSSSAHVLKILSDDEYNTFAIVPYDKHKRCALKRLVMFWAFNLKWYSCRWHPVSKEWSHHCNFALACADYVCRCLPRNILLLSWNRWCAIPNFENNHKNGSKYGKQKKIGIRNLFF